jgi:exonuclease III
MSRHLAGLGRERARRERIFLDQRFSDHAPVIIDYGFNL